MVTNLALTTALLIRADKGDAVLDDIWPGLTVAAFKKDKRVQNFCSDVEEQRPRSERPAHPALRDRSAPKARRVNPEHKDQPVLPVRAANPGRKGLADRPGLPARSDPREIPAPPQLSAS